MSKYFNLFSIVFALIFLSNVAFVPVLSNCGAYPDCNTICPQGEKCNIVYL